MAKNPPKYWDYDYLYTEYVVNKIPVKDIAEECGVARRTILKYLRKHGIPRTKDCQKKKLSPQDINEVVRLYTEGKSTNQIGEVFGVTHRTILNYLKAKGIQPRSMIESQFCHHDISPKDLYYDAEELRRLHWEENVPCSKIAEIVGVSPSAIRNQMHRLGVPTKNDSEAKIGLMVGAKHPNWQGGKCNLTPLLREFFQVNQAPKVLQRDNYCCQLCGTRETELHVHHIIPFSEIVQCILQEHPELSPTVESDKAKLYDIIVHDKRFLDESNLITFCKDCHFYKIHGFKKTISSQAS